jgi:SAM-dependent methyltransferase
MTIPIEQHNIEIHSNAQRWRRKLSLRRSYDDFYREIAGYLTPVVAGRTLELGSGLCAIKKVIPACVTSDLFDNPLVDRRENAYRLGFDDGALDNVVMFDVFHHLRFPGAALKEVARVLRAGGRLALFEPGLGLLGRLVYGLFHKEPLGLGDPILWDAPSGFNADEDTYYAAQGNAFRIFAGGEFADRLLDWKVVAVKKKSAIAYVASGGFTGPQLYPSFAYPALHKLERLLDWLPGIFCARMLVVLEKRGPG